MLYSVKMSEAQGKGVFGLLAASEADIEQAVEVVRWGGVVAFPTDTVYGIGALASIDEAVLRLYQIKGRSVEKAIPVLFADVGQMLRAARSVPEIARRLAERFLPGGLTLVLPKAASVSNIVSGGLDTVALRVPSHPVALAILGRLGAPLATTSANPSGKPSPITAKEVHQILGDQIDLVIDGGECTVGRDSTVVDVSDGVPRLLREGAIAWRDIVEFCQREGVTVVGEPS